ncbi:MAG: mechanosensitive ion channel family protein, partial [Candidatus Taylorbacteria bacterium]|nr:mechanosensitive ion channel family protein [Candidatus Taylorbacteria bacterium]
MNSYFNIESIRAYLDSSFIHTFAGRYVAEALYAIVVFALIFFASKMLYWFAVRRLSAFAERTKTKADDAVLRILQTIRPPFYVFVALYLTLQIITVNVLVGKVANALIIILVVYQSILTLQVVVEYLIGRKATGGGAKASVDLLNTFLKIALWTLGLLLVLSNLGINVTSLIAGLGIGGVAVALALQNILSDLFSSFALYFDKPFVVGDFIIVGDKMGVVQKIGIKTTRIQALQGEELVIS